MIMEGYWKTQVRLNIVDENDCGFVVIEKKIGITGNGLENGGRERSGF